MIDEQQQQPNTQIPSPGSSASSGLTIDVPPDNVAHDLTSPGQAQQMIHVGKRVKINSKTLEQAATSPSVTTTTTPRKNAKKKSDTSPDEKKKTRKRRSKKSVDLSNDEPPKKRGRKKKNAEPDLLSESALAPVPAEFQKESLMRSRSNIRKMLQAEATLREENTKLFDQVKSQLVKYENMYQEQRKKNEVLLKRMKDLEATANNLKNHKSELVEELIATGGFVPDSDEEDSEYISESEEEEPPKKKAKLVSIDDLYA
jgi:hypothetical protein